MTDRIARHAASELAEENNNLQAQVNDLKKRLDKQQEQINRLIREKEPKRSMPHWPPE